MPNFISEDQIEKAILGMLEDKLGFRDIDCFTADADNLNDRAGVVERINIR